MRIIVLTINKQLEINKIKITWEGFCNPKIAVSLRA